MARHGADRERLQSKKGKMRSVGSLLRVQEGQPR